MTMAPRVKVTPQLHHGKTPHQDEPERRRVLLVLALTQGGKEGIVRMGPRVLSSMDVAYVGIASALVMVAGQES